MAMRKKIMGTLILATAAGAIVLQVEDSGTVPAAPSGLSAVAISASRIDLAWTDNAGNETGFAVERAPDVAGSPGTFAQVATPAANATSYGDTGLSASTVYHYRVKATNAAGSSAYSNTSTATTDASSGDGSQPLLTAASFTFAGASVVSSSVHGGLTFGRGLTHRFVGGQLRLLTLGYNGTFSSTGTSVVEFAAPTSLGTTITAKTNEWVNLWGSYRYPNLGGGDEIGLWWEDQGGETGRLWITHCTDYPDDTVAQWTKALSVRNLGAAGAVSNILGEWGFEGVGQRAVFGGVTPIPAWFQSAYSVGPRLYGFGGYTSRMAQGLTPSIGLMAIAGSDLTTYSTGSDVVVPASDFDILADHRGGATGTDWYVGGTPTSIDRGQRNSDVINYFDGGDPRPNPSTPPSVPPVDGAGWLSPAPDGVGRWTWDDTFGNNVCWIDGPNKQGLVGVLACTGGKAYYAGSTPHFDYQHAELQIFDPAHLGEVKTGTRQPWAVQPVASKLLDDDLSPFGLLYGHSGFAVGGNVSGATFVPETKQLWLWITRIESSPYNCVLACYDVDC